MTCSPSVSLCAFPVKLNPPDAPEVNVTVNHTLIRWTEGRPENIEYMDYQVQIKLKAEPWEVSFPSYISTNVQSFIIQI